MKVSIFVGDIADAPAEALCTSTNPRLSLVMGTGAAVRARGEFEILRQCEAIVEAERRKSGRGELPPGSAHVTTAGALPAKIAIHCVASGAGHRTTEPIIRACTAAALARARESACSSIAIPLFGTGHASFAVERAASAIATVLAEMPDAVEQAWIVVQDDETAADVGKIVQSVFGGTEPVIVRSPRLDDGPASSWGDDE